MLSKKKAAAAAILVTLIGWLSWCYFHPSEPAPAAAFAVPSAQREIVSEPASAAPAPIVVSAKLPVATSMPVAVLPTPVPAALLQLAQAPAPSPEPSLLPTPTPAARVADSRTEMIATTNMYAAHASLRSEAEANPDSAQNKAILQAMVSKALARVAAEQKKP